MKYRSGRAGVIEVILDAMSTHTDCEILCEYGCGTICNIVTCGKLSVITPNRKLYTHYKADNRNIAGRHNAIDVVTKVMNAHRDSQDIQKYARYLISVIPKNIGK